MSVRLRGPKVQNLVRVNRAVFIGDFIKEVLEELTVGDHHPLDEIIEMGIVKHHYIGEITVRYLINKEGGGKFKIAEVSIQIDWERFRVNVAGLGEDLEINPDKKKVEQISQVLLLLFAFLDDYRERTAARTELVWHWAPGIDVQEAQHLMNTRQADHFQWLGGEVHDFGAIDAEQLKKTVKSAKIEQDLEYEISVTPKLLDEITLIARVTDRKRVLESLNKPEEKK